MFVILIYGPNAPKGKYTSTILCLPPNSALVDLRTVKNIQSGRKEIAKKLQSKIYFCFFSFQVNGHSGKCNQINERRRKWLKK